MDGGWSIDLLDILLVDEQNSELPDISKYYSTIMNVWKRNNMHTTEGNNDVSRLVQISWSLRWPNVPQQVKKEPKSNNSTLRKIIEIKFLSKS